jgi:Leucine-rich repeat (LRR) protein
LTLHGKQFTTLPSEIGKLTKLVYLGLGGNQFTALPPEIGQLANLIWLYLEGNQLTTLPPEIGKLTKLTELQIGKNPLTDTDLERLKSLESLKQLNVRDTKVSIAGVEAFRKALPNCEIKVPRQHPSQRNQP